MKKSFLKRKKSGTRWFVEPLDDFTNNAIAENMTASGRSADDSVCSSFPDEHGVLHQVWEVPYSDITRLSAGTRQVQLRFRVFSMPIGARNIHEFPFANPHRHVRKSTPVREMKKKLANLK